MSADLHSHPWLHHLPTPTPYLPAPSRPTSPDPHNQFGQQKTHMAGVANSGALIRVPSFSRWQNSSLICTPGYGEAPDSRDGVGVGEGWGAGTCCSAQPPKSLLP